MRLKRVITWLAVAAVALGTMGAASDCGGSSSDSGGDSGPQPYVAPLPAAELRTCVGMVEPDYEWLAIQVGGSIHVALVTITVESNVPEDVLRPERQALPVGLPEEIPSPDIPWCIGIHYPVGAVMSVDVIASDPDRKPGEVLFVRFTSSNGLQPKACGGENFNQVICIWP